MATSTFLERFRPIWSILAMFSFRLGPIGWIVAILFVLMIFGAIDDMLFNRGGKRTAGLPPAGPAALPTPSGAAGPAALPSAPPSSAVSSAVSSAAPDPAIAAAARAELAEAAKLLKEATTSADEAIAQITAWERDIEPLRSNADGETIAAHADLARKMAFLLGEARPSKGDVQQSSERVQALRDQTDLLALTDPPQRLGPGKMIEVRELNRRLREASSAWTDAGERARAIVREARRQQPMSTASSPSAPPAAPPVVTTASSTQPQPPPQAAAPPAPSAESPPSSAAPPPVAAAPPIAAPPSVAASEPSPPKGSTLQDAVERISDQAKIEATNKKIAEEAERQRRENERRIEELKLTEQRAIQKAKLVAEARSDEVLRVLQPFLERRNIQPRLAGSSLQWRQTAEQQPMSLAALENVGALAETLQGLSMLARVGSHRELSSPRWEFSPSSRTWSADTQDRLKQAQELLRRLGPTLADEGLLSR